VTSTPSAEAPKPQAREPDSDAPASCHCVFNHAITAEQRAQVMEQLRYARGVGDLHGLHIHLIRLLGDCPARRTT
jgi:hypothetical protein